jgi:hypothetical protein
MEQNQNPDSPWHPEPDPAQPAEPEPLLTAHMPALVDPLEPRQPENSFTATRRLRHDGWTPEKKRLFLERFAECGIFTEACLAAGMSAKAAYNLRDRDPLFAAGLDAACVKARAPLADEAYSRARNGVVERIYKDGVIVAERHRYDNRLTMSVLARLDSRIDRAEAQGAAHLALLPRWDEYLDALAEDRREDGLALLAARAPSPAPAPAPAANPEHRELRELHPADNAAAEPEEEEDPHSIWEEDEEWWTDYPPPPRFKGDEEGSYGEYGYKRTLSRAEQAVVDAEDAEEKAEERARAEAQREAYFAVEAKSESPPAPARSPAKAKKETRT